MGRVLNPEMLALVAARFKLLADGGRLQLLQSLQTGERTVSELVEVTGLGQTTVSKHLQLLLNSGYVQRRREGLFAYYALADDDVLALCDIMCRRLGAEADTRQKLVRGKRR